MFCINCGKQIPDESAFCQYCGSAVNAVPQAPQQQVVAPVPATPQYTPAPQPMAPQQATPQYAAPAPQAAPQYAPMPQMAPQAAPQFPGQSITMAPVAIGLISPKNAAGEKAKLDNAAFWYVEITNNQLVFSTKGNMASSMFGAVGALATMAACDLKPSFYVEAQSVRNMHYEKKLGGQVLIIELMSGKLLQLKTKLELLNTIENWWRMNIQR